jgi:hypothetical protein
MNTCSNCIHFGTLKGRAGVTLGHVCLAPITTEPPKDGVTRAKNPFVYEAEVDGLCEMWTKKDLLDQPCDILAESGARMVFWVCPDCPAGKVTWKHEGGKSTPHCEQCGKDGESR